MPINFAPSFNDLINFSRFMNQIRQQQSAKAKEEEAQTQRQKFSNILQQSLMPSLGQPGTGGMPSPVRPVQMPTVQQGLMSAFRQDPGLYLGQIGQLPPEPEVPEPPAPIKMGQDYLLDPTTYQPLWQAPPEPQEPESPFIRVGDALYNTQTGQWITPPQKPKPGDTDKSPATEIELEELEKRQENLAKKGEELRLRLAGAKKEKVRKKLQADLEKVESDSLKVMNLRKVLAEWKKDWDEPYNQWLSKYNLEDTTENRRHFAKYAREQ